MSVRVLIVDDHTVVREGLRLLLSTHPGITVVGMAADGSQALDMAVNVEPDVVLMDLRMQKMDGVQATRQLAQVRPQAAVIALTMSDDDTSLLAAVRAGARGYLLKDATGQDVIAAIHAVSGGQIVFGAGVSPQVLTRIQDQGPAPETELAQLSNRERQVLDLLAAGLGNQHIGRRLGISPKTVANVVSNLLTKLGVADRAAAAAKASAMGLGRLQRMP